VCYALLICTAVYSALLSLLLLLLLQVYKILALNCLVSAYLMSSLYLLGLKQGDAQMTALGLVTACMFFCISQVCVGG
jgi:hypothetical protein